MTQLADLAAPKTSATKGFHRDDAKPKLVEEPRYVIPLQHFAQYSRPGGISSMHLKHNLRQIKPDRANPNISAAGIGARP